MQDTNDRDMAILALAIVFIGSLFIGGYAIVVGGLFYVFMTGRLI